MSTFRIEIPEPCSESWEGMTPTACGRFCNRCQKEVIDLTALSDDAVLQTFEQKGSNGNLCIRARADQLAPQVLAVKSVPMMRLALFALALWAVFSGGLFTDAQAQTQQDTLKKAVALIDSSQICTLKVRVTNDGEPDLDARVALLRGNEFITGAATDDNGIARMDGIPAGTFSLKVSSIYTEDTLFTVTLKAKACNEVSVNLGVGKWFKGAWFLPMEEPLIRKDETSRGQKLNLQQIRRTPTN